jgi:hypothetical protein
VAPLQPTQLLVARARAEADVGDTTLAHRLCRGQERRGLVARQPVDLRRLRLRPARLPSRVGDVSIGRRTMLLLPSAQAVCASATEVRARDLTSLPRTGTLRRRLALGGRPYDHALRADGRFALKERPASVAAPVTTAPSQPMPPRTPFGSPLDTAAQSLTRDAARDRCFRRSSRGAQAVQSSRGATAIGPGFRRARATPSRSGWRDRVARLIRPLARLCSARWGRWRRR